nr:NAD-dependent epimerase/dehydratase family protein [Fodinicola acaciae]
MEALAVEECFVVGGHGYVGSHVVTAAGAESFEVAVVSREGGERDGVPSVSWQAWLADMSNGSGGCSAVWLLDGANDEEPERLAELVAVAPAGLHVVLVSTCTVYGNKGDRLCAEDAEIELVSGHARVKYGLEQQLVTSALSWCVLRLGALYGPDERGVRADRVQKWVSEASASGTVTVPDPEHWRGWLHRDQAARALWRAARDRTTGTFNVASVNLTFEDAVSTVARAFGATVGWDGKADPCSYRVDATAAREAGLLDEQPGEDLTATVERFIASGSWRS